MYVDSQLMLSDAQAVTASGASSNSVDMGPNSRKLDVGDPIYLFVNVDQSFTADGSATLSIGVQTDDDSAFGTAVTLMTTQAYAKTALTAGRTPIILALPHGVKRYLRLYYTVATGPMTAGKLSAVLASDVEGNFI
jgi:hypothetical protein